MSHGSIGALAQLLQLLERAGVALIVHDNNVGPAAKVSHADGRV